MGSWDIVQSLATMGFTEKLVGTLVRALLGLLEIFQFVIQNYIINPGFSDRLQELAVFRDFSTCGD
jgi:hypothetical protein